MTTEPAPASAFYADGSGDKLVDVALLTAPVKEFLQAELDLMESVAQPQCDVLVEVGSMYGLHLDWAFAHGKRYVGVDVVARYLESGRATVAARGWSEADHRFVLAAAQELAVVELPPGRALAFFPFNSIGNIADLPGTLAALRESDLPFLISSYRTDALAARRRREYYESCDYRNLSARTDEEGVWFTADEGLNTVAYHPDYVLATCERYGLHARAVPFSEFGVAYVTCFDD